MKKFLPYILILIIVTGFFSLAGKANALSSDGKGTCYAPAFGGGIGPEVPVKDKAECDKKNEPLKSGDPLYSWVPAGSSTVSPSDPNAPPAPTPRNAFEKQISENKCSFGFSEGSFYPGCFIEAAYGIFYVIPSFLLWASAYFFNVLISITLGSNLLANSNFLIDAWGVVRDISNIFFILILLYVAIQLILGLGGHDVKKMIAKVVVIAILINFSMFFTEIIIDTSNVLALVFYNQLVVGNKVAGEVKDNYPSVTGEKDVAGAMVGSFDPTKTLTDDFFNGTKEVVAFGQTFKNTNSPVAPGIIIGVTIISGLIMGFAAYCFFLAGLAFVGRLIELWVLVIFSPFAFISSTVPFLSSIEYAGWGSWFKRLLKTAFMAPFFMFFMYFIFLLVAQNPFKDIAKNSGGSITTILLVVIPALVILLLLKQATKVAKEGSGQLGEMVVKAGKSVGGLVGGIALGAATGGAAVAARATIGRAGHAAANSQWAKRWESSYFGGEAGMSVLKKVGSASYDVRAAKIGGKSLASTGLKVGEAQKGGFTKIREEDVKKRQKREKEIEVGEDEKLMQGVRRAQITLQEAKSDPRTQADLLRLNEGDTNAAEGSAERMGLGQLERASTAADRALTDAERDLKDAISHFGALSDQANTARITQSIKLDERDGARNNLLNRQQAIRDEGHGVHDAEVNLKKAENAVTGENKTRKKAYADKIQSGSNRAFNFILSGGQYALIRGANEAANKIRANIKAESHGSGHGGDHGGHAPAAAAHPAPAHTPEPAAPAATATGGHTAPGGHH